MSSHRLLHPPPSRCQRRRHVLLSLFTLALLLGLPQKQIVERIAGDAVKVETLVRPGQSPATYDPTPQQMVALARAAAYFRIGAPFENVWIPKMQSPHPKLRIVDTRAGITLLPMDRPAAGHDHGHAGPAAAGGTLDPHIWTDPLRIKQQAANISDGLIALAPARCWPARPSGTSWSFTPPGAIWLAPTGLRRSPSRSKARSPGRRR